MSTADLARHKTNAGEDVRINFFYMSIVPKG